MGHVQQLSVARRRRDATNHTLRREHAVGQQVVVAPSAHSTRVELTQAIARGGTASVYGALYRHALPAAARHRSALCSAVGVTALARVHYIQGVRATTCATRSALVPWPSCLLRIEVPPRLDLSPSGASRTWTLSAIDRPLAAPAVYKAGPAACLSEQSNTAQRSKYNHQQDTILPTRIKTTTKPIKSPNPW